MNRLSLSDLSVSLGRRNRLHIASFEWEIPNKRPLIILRGGNGTGKTTLLNILSGHIVPTKGQARLGSVCLSGNGPRWAAKCGVVRSFQTPLLCSHLTVWQNVALATHEHWWQRNDRLRGEIHRRLTEVGLQASAERSPSELSFGQRRIAELVRVEFTLKRSMSRLLLLDEPLAGLDAQHRADALRLITSMVNIGLPTIVVEHCEDLESIMEGSLELELSLGKGDRRYLNRTTSPAWKGERVES